MSSSSSSSSFSYVRSHTLYIRFAPVRFEEEEGYVTSAIWVPYYCICSRAVTGNICEDVKECVKECVKKVCEECVKKVCEECVKRVCEESV